MNFLLTIASLITTIILLLLTSILTIIMISSISDFIRNVMKFGLALAYKLNGGMHLSLTFATAFIIIVFSVAMYVISPIAICFR